MKTTVLLSIVLVAFATAHVSAQTKFTSTYTSLGGASCKFYKGGDGQDGMSLCKGPGGYQVRIYSSAMATHIVAERKGSDENFALATVSLGFNQSKSKVEWRHHNGKPFAAILRVPKYGDAPEEGGVGKQIGENLVIVGLAGYERIEGSVDAKKAGANAEARAIADSLFWGKD